MADLSQLVKAYDVRGVVPDQLDEALAELFGAAFATVTEADAVVVGHDMRPSSPALSRAFARGAPRAAPTSPRSACAPPTSCTSPAAASTSPARCSRPATTRRSTTASRCAARAPHPSARTPDSQTSAPSSNSGPKPAAPGHHRAPGTVARHDVLADYATHLRNLVDLRTIRPLKVVVDAGNGMGGHTVPTVLDGLPVDLVPMYFELDGTFPNHEANPLDPKNLVDLQARVRETGADIGLAFDGDADRCFAVDERGEPVSPPRSPPWSPPASWPSTPAPPSSTT